ncbi:kinesin-like protein Klp98A [Agrilus planipennis]|uniref:Kinesin-like protein Klp98A n=1 Tax=Agrilus planipennis TaxID=224129 RepID=A0A7F5RK01_AGRPL|nr:kinesin-like protein Klp98A [Agrilus planipennis]
MATIDGNCTGCSGEDLLPSLKYIEQCLICGQQMTPENASNLGQKAIETSVKAKNNCDNIISITNYILRGAGNQTHYEYEVKINTTDDKWTVYRRYSRFRELYLVMKSKYGQKVSNIPFPPRQLFRNTEAVAKNRKRQLETYLRLLIQSLGEPITREALINISPFFKKGIFENGKYSTS